MAKRFDVFSFPYFSHNITKEEFIFDDVFFFTRVGKFSIGRNARDHLTFD